MDKSTKAFCICCSDEFRPSAPEVLLDPESVRQKLVEMARESG